MENEKEVFEEPVMEIITFEKEDIITTSIGNKSEEYFAGDEDYF